MKENVCGCLDRIWIGTGQRHPEWFANRGIIAHHGSFPQGMGRDPFHLDTMATKDDAMKTRVWRLALWVMAFFLVGEPIIGMAGPKPHTPGEQSTEDAIWSSEDQAQKSAVVSDPLEPWNRAMFTFNDKASEWVLEPVATGYQALVPEGGRIAVRNFFQNLKAPIHFTNALLQGKGQAAGEELGRFLVNSTLGVAGLFDVASLHFNLHSSRADLGQTLGRYGVGDKLYLVWPVFGPSNARDTVGDIGDWFLDPLNYVPRNFWDQVGIKTFSRVNETSLRLEEFQTLRTATLDPYVAVRSGYLQKRQEKVSH
ncbi:MAG: VacJ family lipoprotein [Magnetococcales bacterium]|nr:VacJ family lipoprotein [Magnetococcales bacterium]